MEKALSKMFYILMIQEHLSKHVKVLVLKFKKQEIIFTVKGLKEFKNPNGIIDAENSGTTIRIAAAISSLSEGKTVLSGDKSLRQRPMQPLLDALESIGAKCSSKMVNLQLQLLEK